MIETIGLMKRLGERVVARALALHIRPGESVAIVGPSGSGKTTLLRLIAGLDRVDAGEIRIAGKPVDARDPAHERGIAFLFQSAALWPHMNVAGNILFGLEDHPRPWRLERMEQLLEGVGLAGFAHRSIATLSGGEARRVALARALAPQRPILFLDEPTSNLNGELRARILGLIAQERQAHGTTILLATHEPLDAQRLADRCFSLCDGQLVAQGRP